MDGEKAVLDEAQHIRAMVKKFLSSIEGCIDSAGVG